MCFLTLRVKLSNLRAEMGGRRLGEVDRLTENLEPKEALEAIFLSIYFRLISLFVQFL